MRCFWAIRRIDRDYVEPTLYKSEAAATSAAAARRGYDVLPLTSATASQARQRELEEALRDALAAAYEQGCLDVQANYRPDPDPEFGEAARDYAHSALAALLNSPAGEQPECPSCHSYFEAGAKAVYEQWADQPGYVPWVPRGNSDKQCDARRIVRKAFDALFKQPEGCAAPSPTGGER